MNDLTPSELLDFTGKVVLVTGAGGGIGSGIARRFAEAGAKLAINYRSNEAGARAGVAEIEGGGGEAIAIRADVTKKDEVERLFAQTAEAFGRIDVLINNAGSYPIAGLLEMSETDWDSMIETNLRSAFLCTQEAAKRMIAGGSGGAIVNVASIEGSFPAKLHSHYAAAKAGVLAFTKAAANELGRHGIRVNAVSPGLIWREGIEEAWPEGVNRWRRAAPLSRLGMPGDVADACLFLASPAASWITGCELRVDGGVTATEAF